LAERLSVVALVPLSLWFVASIISHAAFIRWLMPLATSFMILLLLALFHHSALGLQVAIYVHSNAKFAAVIAVRLGCYGFAVAGIVATLRIAFDG
jgi:succinate dehydrogenase / fumarate reductase membrane anchor subunit